MRAQCESYEGLLSAAAADLLRDESELSRLLSEERDVAVMCAVLGLSKSIDGQTAEDEDEDNEDEDSIEGFYRSCNAIRLGSPSFSAADLFSRRLEEMGVGNERRAAARRALLESAMRRLLMQLQEEEMGMARWLSGGTGSSPSRHHGDALAGGEGSRW